MVLELSRWLALSPESESITTVDNISPTCVVCPRLTRMNLSITRESFLPVAFPTLSRIWTPSHGPEILAPTVPIVLQSGFARTKYHFRRAFQILGTATHLSVSVAKLPPK